MKKSIVSFADVGLAAFTAMPSIVTAKFIAAAAMVSFSAAGQTIWQIGKKDGTGNEFALAPTGYADFLQNDFGWEDKFFLVGYSYE